MVNPDSELTLVQRYNTEDPYGLREQILELPEIQDHTRVIWGCIGGMLVSSGFAAKIGLDEVLNHNYSKFEDYALVLSAVTIAGSTLGAFWRASIRNTRIFQIAQSPDNLALEKSLQG